MFRRKESDTGRPSHGSSPDLGYPRPVLEAKSQPELPRRAVEVPAPMPAVQERSLPAAEQRVEGKQLIVGQGISLSGEITACDRLIVQGSVQVTLNQTRAIEIAPSGRFTNGKAEVEEADISGLYEGELTVRKRLTIRGTGLVRGTVRYGELEIENGGKLTGAVSLLAEQREPGSAEPATLPTPGRAVQAA